MTLARRLKGYSAAVAASSGVFAGAILLLLIGFSRVPGVLSREGVAAIVAVSPS